MLTTTRANRVLARVTSRTDLLLVAVIISVVFMMILPLPPALVDVLIAINMTLAAMLLMVAMYLPAPLSFSSFPSVLLVTTLFRLGISIATTRLILLEADAGDIVRTFGEFVVGGNIVVGMVVFLILTIVQFVVITRGAERVAEVAARFSLDAMPGKQMAIDADLRAGAIDMVEARRRRSTVEKESQMYGAMDGALKFVKGDAIAGLIIVAVNLLGGIAVGMGQHGLPIGEAARVYSVLTIGDGLIAQIPALFIAICAGIVVTRVPAADGSVTNVGKDMGAQILAQPRALVIAAIIALGLGMIPGMPTSVFFALAGLLGMVGFILLRAGDTGQSTTGTAGLSASGSTLSPSGASTDMASGSGAPAHAPTVPLILDVASAWHDSLGPALAQSVDAARQMAYWRVGVVYPGIVVRSNDRLPEGTCVLLVDEIAVAGPPIGGTPDQQTLPALEEALRLALVRQARDFIGIQQTRGLMQACEAHVPELVKECMRVLPIQRIAEILQRLVAEQISIRNIHAVLEALVEWGMKEKDTVVLTEYVRIALKRQITSHYADAANQLPAYLLAPDVEDMLRQAVRQTSGGSYLALDPDTSKRIIKAVLGLMGQHAAAQPAVLLTSMDIRRYAKKLMEQDAPELPVLSYQELAPYAQIQPLGSVTL